MSTTAIERLRHLGFELPHPSSAVGFYVPAIRVGNLVLTSGQLPFVGKELAFTGKVGSDVHEEQAAHAARLCALNALAAIGALVGDLDQVARIVRLEGFVASAAGFNAQPRVLNSASELMVNVFGDAGRHTRTAVGVSELPLNAPVELAVWAEVTES